MYLLFGTKTVTNTVGFSEQNMHTINKEKMKEKKSLFDWKERITIVTIKKN